MSKFLLLSQQLADHLSDNGRGMSMGSLWLVGGGLKYVISKDPFQPHVVIIQYQHNHSPPQLQNSEVLHFQSPGRMGSENLPGKEEGWLDYA